MRFRIRLRVEIVCNFGFLCNFRFLYEFILKNSSVSGGGAVLVVNQALSASKIQLIVTATDMDGLEDTITLNITIMNSNRPPNVTSALFYVAEDIAPGSSIATLNGNDPDLDNIAYSIAAGDVDSLFNINEVTGTITYQENSISSNGLNFICWPTRRLRIHLTSPSPGMRSSSSF